jgi:hypothetical protein
LITKYKIEFYLDPYYSRKDDNSNRKIVNEVVKAFGNDLKKIKQESLLIYFGCMSKYKLSNLRGWTYGIVLIRGTQEYNDFVKENQPEIKLISYFKTFIYFIYLNDNIRKAINKIEKVETIAHELQHVLQYINLPIQTNKKHTKLFEYYSSRKLNYWDLPKEVDALRKSKYICYKMFDQKTIDSFYDEKIDYYAQISETQAYYKRLKYIDLDTPCDMNDLTGDIDKLYEAHENDIQSNL